MNMEDGSASRSAGRCSRLRGRDVVASKVGTRTRYGANNQPLLDLSIKLMGLAVDNAAVILTGFRKAILVRTFPSLSSLSVAGGTACAKLCEVCLNAGFIFRIGTIPLTMRTTTIKTSKTATARCRSSRRAAGRAFCGES
jgi:hypothetical protein